MKFYLGEKEYRKRKGDQVLMIAIDLNQSEERDVQIQLMLQRGRGFEVVLFGFPSRSPSIAAFHVNIPYPDIQSLVADLFATALGFQRLRRPTIDELCCIGLTVYTQPLAHVWIMCDEETK